MYDIRIIMNENADMRVETCVELHRYMRRHVPKCANMFTDMYAGMCMACLQQRLAFSYEYRHMQTHA